jgi:hypothetical protein
MSVLPAGSIAAGAPAAAAAAAAAVPAFNPPSLEVAEYTYPVFKRADMKVGKYYVMSLYDSPRAGSIVKVTKVVPIALSPRGYGYAAISVQEESGGILPPQTTGAFKFFEYRIPPNSINFPNSEEPNEPLEGNAIRAHTEKRRNYRQKESNRLSKERFYTRRGRKARKTRKSSKSRKNRR